MNPDKPNDPGSEDFGLDLNEIESQYQSLQTDEPAAMLDQAILNKARHAVESQVIRPWSFSWMHATATAAVLVLGLTLVLQQRSDVPEPIQMREEADTDTVSTDEESFQKLTTSSEIIIDKLELMDSIDKDTINSSQGAAGEESALRSRQAVAEKRVDEPARSFDLLIAAPELNEAKTPASSTVLRKNEDIPSKMNDSAGIIAVGAAFASDHAEAVRNPEEWLALILELRHDHESADGITTLSWESELESFLKAWPDYPLPKEITDYLATRPGSE